MTAPTMKQRLALRLFQSVTEDVEATWEGLTDEERDDALKWAGEALEELRDSLVGWLDTRIASGGQGDGLPIEMAALYAQGRMSAFEAVRSLILREADPVDGN